MLSPNLRPKVVLHEPRLLIGSLLSMVEGRALMGAEVFRYDQTLPSKPGSRPT
jgi:hypothetical protein